jgi:HAD superfamily hydrolase (TIGR01509 family)
LTALFDGVDLLSLDAGNTIIFLDHARLEAIAREAGHDVAAATLIDCEGRAKRALGGDGALVEVAWPGRAAPGAAGWGVMLGTLFALAGVPREALPNLLERLWANHVRHNLYSKVPDGFEDAMALVRARGVKVAVVSNSEGMLEPLFEKLGIRGCFDAVVDSAKVGVEKPDPRIFAIACDRTRTTAARALHLGDTMATDIVGARRAGMRAALVDPFGHYEGLYPDVPRVEGAVAAARAIAARRG